MFRESPEGGREAGYILSMDHNVASYALRWWDASDQSSIESVRHSAILVGVLDLDRSIQFPMSIIQGSDIMAICTTTGKAEPQEPASHVNSETLSLLTYLTNSLLRCRREPDDP